MTSDDQINTVAQLQALYELPEGDRIARFRSPAVSISVWRAVASSDDEWTQRDLLLITKRSTRDHLEEMMSSRFASVRSLIGGKNAVTRDQLARLARDPDASVRRKVLVHPRLDLAILRELLNDPEETVRAEAALTISARAASS